MSWPLSAGHVKRLVVSFFVPIVLTGKPGGEWLVGPYPNNWRTGTNRPLSGTRAGRSAYLNPGLENILYEYRWFKTPTDAQCAAAPAFEAKAFEIFRLPTTSPRPNGVLVVHGRVIDLSGPWPVLNTVVNHNEQHGKAMRSWIKDLLPTCAAIYPTHRRAEHITLITFSSTRTARIPGLSQARSTPDADAWLGYLANSGRIVPDVQMIGSVGQVIGMSVSLRGLVSKAGIALVGLRKDSGRSDGSEGFDYGGAEFFLEGLYSDVVLLAQLQKYKVRELREKLNDARTSGAKAQQLAALEQELIAFRVNYWRTDFAPQGSEDDFLQAYHDIHDVVAELDEVHSQISEYSDQVQRRQQELTNAVLGILTVLAFPVGTAVAIWSGLARHTLGDLWLALGAGVAMAALTLLLPGTRALLAAFLPGAYKKASKWITSL